MKIKVCGMREEQNIKGLLTLPIDFIGFIFYEKSTRYVSDPININQLHINKVGVFVDANEDYIREKVIKFQLDYIQLHGSESLSFCKKLSDLSIIKAISIESEKDFEKAYLYEGLADFLLFDTKTPSFGGSGVKFDWDILSKYSGETPFFLSGGISETDALTIKNLKHPKLYGIDLNSKFEIEPGLKDLNRLSNFTEQIKQH